MGCENHAVTHPGKSYTIYGNACIHRWLREMISQLTPSVNRPEVKGSAYYHTFCEHELEFRIVASVRKRDVSTTYKMVRSCCAFGCTNWSGEGKNLQFYSFPKRPVERSRWIAAVGRESWQPNQHSRICSAHFVIGK